MCPVCPSSLLLLTSVGVILSPGQITGLAAGGAWLCWEQGMSERTFTPLAPCPGNLHPINLLPSWQEVGTAWVCLLNTWILAVRILLGVRLSCPWAHQRTQSLLPRLPKLLCLVTYPLHITLPPLAPLARIPGHSGYLASLLSLQFFSC